MPKVPKRKVAKKKLKSTAKKKVTKKKRTDLIVGSLSQSYVNTEFFFNIYNDSKAERRWVGGVHNSEEEAAQHATTKRTHVVKITFEKGAPKLTTKKV